MEPYREVLNGFKYRKGADIWSFGAVIYEIVTGKKPYAEYELGVQILTAVIVRKEIPKIQDIQVYVIERERERERERDEVSSFF